MAWRRVAAIGAGVLVLALAAPSGCGVTENAGDDPTATSTSAIIDGDASPPAQNFVVEVVHPVSNGAEFVCSGSLVAPNLVLTARHCITGTSGDAFTCDESGNGSDGGALGADYDPATVLIYAGKDAPTQFTAASAHGVRFFHDDAANVCNHDLALVELDKPLDAYPTAHLDLDTPLTTGEPVTVIGWGVIADGGMPSVRQARGGIPILAVGPAVQALGYDVPGNEFAVGESICDGDSGGPALDAANAIVGIVSSGGNGNSSMSANAAVTCLGADTVNLYTATSAFRDVILGAFASVGATPMRVSVPMGESCTTSKECTSGLCSAVEADAGTVCTQDCATTACPDGFKCDVTGTKSLCVSAPSSGCTVAPGSAPWGSMLSIGLAVVGLVGTRRRRTPRATC